MTKNLIIIRGLPGAGKSTLVQALCADGMDPGVFSLETYMPDKSQTYPSSDFREWAKDMETRVETCMQSNYRTLIIHDVFAQSWQWRPYTQLAEKYDYTVHFLIVENRHEGRSVHTGISDARMDKYRREFRVDLG